MDAIVAQGSEAGGHRGSFAAPFETSMVGTMALVPQVRDAVRVPVTVKCRIGIDDQDPEESLDTLTRTVIAAGTAALIVHARKAWLDGLSPRDNRDIPPLDYERVYRLKRAYPGLDIAINGGILQESTNFNQFNTQPLFISSTNAVETLTFTGSPTGGNFSLSYGGATTAAIAYSTSAATLQTNVQNALNALPTIGGGSAVVSVSGPTITVTRMHATGEPPRARSSKPKRIAAADHTRKTRIPSPSGKRIARARSAAVGGRSSLSQRRTGA